MADGDVALGSLFRLTDIFGLSDQATLAPATQQVCL